VQRILSVHTDRSAVRRARVIAQLQAPGGGAPIQLFILSNLALFSPLASFEERENLTCVT